MTIRRRMNDINNSKDQFGNVEITLTPNEMYEIYNVIKLHNLKEDIENYLFNDYELDDKAHDISEDIVDEISMELDNDSYLCEATAERLWEYIKKKMSTKYGINNF